MRAAGEGQDNGGAGHQQCRHDGKDNPDWIPGGKHTHIHQPKPEIGSGPSAHETIA
jgi:hypothetical protein